MCPLQSFYFSPHPPVPCYHIFVQILDSLLYLSIFSQMVPLDSNQTKSHACAFYIVPRMSIPYMMQTLDGTMYQYLKSTGMFWLHDGWLNFVQ